jgi:hypothetical protein
LLSLRMWTGSVDASLVRFSFDHMYQDVLKLYSDTMLLPHLSSRMARPAPCMQMPKDENTSLREDCMTSAVEKELIVRITKVFAKSLRDVSLQRCTGGVVDGGGSCPLNTSRDR